MEVLANIFEFEGAWGLPSKCGVRILEHGDHQVVVVSELYKENPGTSIAQVSASLCMQICKAYGLDYNKLVYIEHNPDMHSKLSFYEEEMFLVHFEKEDGLLKNPSWERLTPEMIRYYVDSLCN